MELESFLEIIEKDTEQAARETAEPTGSQPAAQPELNHCPHCQTRLSALDNKLGQCMACNRRLIIGGDAEVPPDRRPVSIGI
jgi:uncharacterized protein with PIN domain